MRSVMAYRLATQKKDAEQPELPTSAVRILATPVCHGRRPTAPRGGA